MANRRFLFMAAAALLVIGVFLLFFRLPHARSEVERNGVKAEGQVNIQDSQSLGDGRTLYRVGFTFTDEHRVAHMAMNEFDDAGLWNELKKDKYTPVYYLPSNPDIAYIPGAIAIEKQSGTGIAVPLGSPHTGSMRFLAWSALLVCIPVWYLAFKAPKDGGRPKQKKPPVITRH